MLLLFIEKLFNNLPFWQIYVFVYKTRRGSSTHGHMIYGYILGQY